MKTLSTIIVLTYILALFASCTGEIKKREIRTDKYITKEIESRELLDILEQFTNGNSWDAGTDNIAIEWLSKLEIGNSETPKYFDANYTKRGMVVLTMDSVYQNYYMREQKHAVPWSINMYGGRTLYLACMLKTDTTGGNDAVEIPVYFKKKNIVLERYCFAKITEDYGGSGLPWFEKYKIRLKNGRQIYLLYEVNGGNNYYDVNLYFNSDGSEDIKFPESFLINYKPDKIKCYFEIDTAEFHPPQ